LLVSYLMTIIICCIFLVLGCLGLQIILYAWKFWAHLTDLVCLSFSNAPCKTCWRAAVLLLEHSDPQIAVEKKAEFTVAITGSSASHFAKGVMDRWRFQQRCSLKIFLAFLSTVVKHASQVFLTSLCVTSLNICVLWPWRERLYKELTAGTSWGYCTNKPDCDLLGSLFFSAEAQRWRPTRSSSNRTRTGTGWDSAGTSGPPAAWKPPGSWSRSPVSSHHSRRGLIFHRSSTNQFCAAGPPVRRCSTHSGELNGKQCRFLVSFSLIIYVAIVFNHVCKILFFSSQLCLQNYYYFSFLLVFLKLVRGQRCTLSTFGHAYFPAKSLTNCFAHSFTVKLTSEQKYGRATSAFKETL